MSRKVVLLMPQIRPITELRNTTEMSNLCHAKREPIFITKNGYGDMVLMSMELYDELAASAATDAAIKEAEEEFSRSGELFDARAELNALRKKYLG